MSWTNAAVTEAGLALQAKLVDGQTLGFLRVAAGTGTVDPSVLANQTALANEKQTLTFQPPNVLDGAKIKVPVMLNNIGLESGYTMQQLGFFAEDPDNGEILYAIVQDEVGDTVPSQTESPGFVIEWAFVFQYGNASEVTVKFDPVGLVSIGMVGAPNGVAGLDDKGAVPIEQGGTGATTAQDAVIALGALLALAAAAAYNPEGSYAVGDYCTHGGKLHKCNTAIPDGEAWNEEHWTETTVAAELAEVRASLSNKVSRAGELVPLGTNILTLAPGRYSVDGVPDTDMANSMNLPVTTWHYEIDVIAAANATGLVSNYKVIIVYPSSNVVLPYINIMNYEGKWTGWTQIPTTTPPEVHNLTLASEVTNIDGYQSVYFKTQENIVTVILQCKGTFADNQHTASLPVDCYPKRNMKIPCIDGYTRTVGFLLVNIDGTIRVSFGESEKTSAISVFSFDAAEV